MTHSFGPSASAEASGKSSCESDALTDRSRRDFLRAALLVRGFGSNASDEASGVKSSSSDADVGTDRSC